MMVCHHHSTCHHSDRCVYRWLCKLDDDHQTALPTGLMSVLLWALVAYCTTNIYTYIHECVRHGNTILDLAYMVFQYVVALH